MVDLRFIMSGKLSCETRKDESLDEIFAPQRNSDDFSNWLLD